MLVRGGGHTAGDVTCPLLVWSTGVKILFQQVLCHGQAVFTVPDRTKLAGRFRPHSLTAHAGSNGFDVVLRQFVSKTRRTITLFCLSGWLTDGLIADETEFLAWAYLIATQAPDIPTAAG